MSSTVGVVGPPPARADAEDRRACRSSTLPVFMQDTMVDRITLGDIDVMLYLSLVTVSSQRVVVGAWGEGRKRWGGRRPALTMSRSWGGVRKPAGSFFRASHFDVRTSVCCRQSRQSSSSNGQPGSRQYPSARTSGVNDSEEEEEKMTSRSVINNGLMCCQFQSWVLALLQLCRFERIDAP